MAWGSSKDKQQKSPLIVERSVVSKAVEKSYKKYANGFQRPSILLDLEPRMMFDGAAPAVVDDIIDTDKESSTESLPDPDVASEEETNSDDDEESESPGSSETPTSSSSTEPAPSSDDALFEQLTNNNAELLVDPAANLELDKELQLDSYESTLDDLEPPLLDGFHASTNTEEVLIDDTPVQNAVPLVALDTNAVLETNEADEQEAFDYTDDSDIDRVVFFDTTVVGYEDLLEGLINDLQNPDAESLTSEHINPIDVDTALEIAAENDGTLFVNGVAIHLLQGEEGQIEQITDTLTAYSDLSAIDIISHGTTGEIQLGNQRLNNESLDTYSNLVAQWGDALSANGDILLYGCDVAEHGQDFLNSIAELTDADVAGSDDLTGNAQFGGDFDLEARTGLVEAQAILTADNATAFIGTLLDTDSDGTDDSIDSDDDNDGIPDSIELALGPDGVVNFVAYTGNNPPNDLSVDPAASSDTLSDGSLGSSLASNHSDLTAGGSLTVAADDSDTTIVISGLTAGETLANAIANDSFVEASFDVESDLLLNAIGFNTGGATNAGFGYSYQIQVSNDGFTTPGQIVTTSDGNGPSGVVEDNTPGENFDFEAASGAFDGVIDSNDTFLAEGERITVRVYIFDNADTDANFSDFTLFADVVATDTDSDGTVDRLDADSDNDGIADAVESTFDTDSDGTLDFRDTDSDSDGIADSLESTVDTDSDGVFDFIDIDSDSDGIVDSLESISDTDSDGTLDFQDTDADGDGLADSFEGTQDTDGDSVSDFRDTDSDSDGIPDSLEVIPVDTDGDGIEDSIDIDDDNDGIIDTQEAGILPVVGTVGIADPFPVDQTGFFQNIGTTGGNSDLNLLNPLTNQFETLGSIDFLVNGSSFNPEDGFIYGVAVGGFPGTALDPITGNSVSVADDDIVFFDRDGEVFLVGSPPVNLGGGFAGGIYFDTTNPNDPLNGLLVIRAGNGAGNTLVTIIDPTDASLVNQFNFSPGFSSADLVNVDGVFYGLNIVNDGSANGGNADAVLSSFDISALSSDPNFGDGSLLSTTIGSTSVSVELPNYTPGGGGSGAGAAFASTNPITGEIEIFFFSNDTGQIYQIEDFDTATPTAQFFVQGTPSGANDGAGSIIAAPPTTDSLPDLDSDGISSTVDLDSDNDGISDLVESGDAAGIAADTNQDGFIDLTESLDSDSDGLLDIFEGLDLTNNIGSVPVDTDGDLIADYLDLDSDNDGISDLNEGQSTIDFVDLSTTNDSDNDGIVDELDINGVFGGALPTFVQPEDTDSDGVADFLDTDSDADGIADSIESGVANLLTGVDIDLDGIDDGLGITYNQSQGETAITFLESDSDGEVDFRDTDSDSDGIADSIESTADTDSDGVVDFLDTDSDSDGIADSLESTADTDSDGTLDFQETDSDADGIADSLESTVDSDSDGTLDFLDTDADSDGIADSLESTVDSDSDGTPDFLDTDSDSDGIADSLESGDSDSDGTPDFQETDSDADGIADSLESTVDSDSDGTSDFLDTDSDSDGIADSL